MKHFIIFLSCFVFITSMLMLVSCKKEAYKPYQLPYSKLLGSWKMTSMSISPAFTGTENIFFKEQLDDCGKDNMYEFGVDYVMYFSFKKGITSCDSTDAHDQWGFCEYNDTTKLLRIDLNDYSSTSDKIYNMTITQLTDNVFTGVMSHTIDGVFYTGTWSFIKQ